ncbi:8084_t:CDS:2 [Diversispora eburnea]|uniref:8084_t:CDS:1 n=1 Tax=Diversispora eburnea TaxID=1213867 RepID=A0A9N8Z5X9_9GLOM|nr:8084_t:CDS:2 [Diversispora eburnea]
MSTSKRGRKPKVKSSEANTEINEIETSPKIKSLEESTTTTKRGRKTKFISTENDTKNKNDIESTTVTSPTTKETTTTTKRGRKPKNNKGVETPKLTEAETTTTIRRGRKKETATNNTDIVNSNEIDINNSNETNISDTTDTQTTTTSNKRGKRKQNKTSNDIKNSSPENTNTGNNDDTIISVETTQNTTIDRRGKGKNNEENEAFTNINSEATPTEITVKSSTGRKSKRKVEDIPSDSDNETKAQTSGRKKARKIPNKIVETDDEDGQESKGKKSKTNQEEEKRLARFRFVCSSATQDRIGRAVSQRMYMINRTEINDLHQEFTVLGSIGNVYTVVITKVPSCSCPDFQKVLRVDRRSNLIYQKALLTDELKSIFDNAAPDPTQASKKVQEQYAAIASGSQPVEEANDKRRPIDGDCPICYEPLDEKENLVWCKSGCGNNLHKDCFAQWKKSKSVYDKVTCVYCRIEWEEEKSGEPTNDEGYINLAEAQGMSIKRDGIDMGEVLHGR